MTANRRDVAWAGGCLAAGSLAWAFLVVVPGRRPAPTGVLLGAPALLTAGWLAPRGDGDGLWLLWFPTILFAMAVCAGAAAVTVALLRRRGSRPPG